ncbi:hypothetical protein ABIE78_002937 [Sinorhizobium fredii]|uniref:Uncharacterized protein n=1 Tax=Sinorhizobium fredii (strain USDA 257) TaxID=1185652 RepID=I3X5U8_SINF2|nr:hypothetical protein [Sinorhizobium fredii]AFL51254.1 hypothetical protein USDA257_c26800 [Sinorhizobium fredii USDA 257]
MRFLEMSGVVLDRLQGHEADARQPGPRTLSAAQLAGNELLPFPFISSSAISSPMPHAYAIQEMAAAERRRRTHDVIRRSAPRRPAPVESNAGANDRAESDEQGDSVLKLEGMS